MLEILETEHGMFTNNEYTGQTAQEVYEEWLENKDKQNGILPEQSELYLLSEQVLELEMKTLDLQESKEELAATNSELSEYVLYLDERLTVIESN